MKKPSLDKLIQVLEAKGYKVFTKGQYNLNLAGIRSAQPKAGAWDDWIVVFYQDQGEWVHRFYEATTDPGTYYLNHPLRKTGTAILKPGNYARFWRLSPWHPQNHYFRQVGVAQVYRDNNKDDILDLDPDSVQVSRWLGINLHSTGRSFGPESIGRHSAGCQVIRHKKEYRQLYKLGKKQRDSGMGSHFSYSLLEEADFG